MRLDLESSCFWNTHQRLQFVSWCSLWVCVKVDWSWPVFWMCGVKPRNMHEKVAKRSASVVNLRVLSGLGSLRNHVIISLFRGQSVSNYRASPWDHDYKTPQDSPKSCNTLLYLQNITQQMQQTEPLEQTPLSLLRKKTEDIKHAKNNTTPQAWWIYPSAPAQSTFWCFEVTALQSAFAASGPAVFFAIDQAGLLPRAC